VKKNLDGFVWDYFRDPEHLGQCRLAAMRQFLADFEPGKQEGRYVAASLPTLPFTDGQFSLALVSHLLFLYSEQLDLDRQWSPHVGPVREYLEQTGFVVEVVAVEYEFQRAEEHAGNRMLRVRRDQTTVQSG
jgi:hypothetical protein